jgi:hypothetical protein
MRTKALLLTAALSAAGVATSMAQVYSVNAVGYVNLSIAPGLAIVANPLNGTNNNLNTVLPLANDGSQDGVTIYRFNVAAQNYSSAIQWVGGFGWFSADPAEDYTVNPGEAFFVQNTLSGPLNVTFVGDVPQGSLHNSFAGANNLSLRSSQVPQAAPIGDPSTPNTLGFPALDGDTLYVFNPATQNYKEAYQYVGGFGWFSANADDPGAAGPTIPVATGFFVQGTGPLSRSWDRTFSVN